MGLALFAVLQAVCAAAFWALTLIPDCPRWLVILFWVLAVYLPAAADPVQVLWAARRF